MYNGTDPLPPETRLELSDCFLGDDVSHGKSLLNLKYSQLVSLVREYWSRRNEDLFRSMDDPAYQQQLLEEFGLT